MKLKSLGICGIISLLSYTAMVLFAPLKYPGYDFASMAISELSAVGAPSKDLANQLNALFGPCGIVSIMAVCVAIAGVKSKSFHIGIYMFAGMEWIVEVGYKLFPWIEDASALDFQNMMHLIITGLTVALSIISLVLIIFGSRGGELRKLGTLAIICLIAMFGGAIGTNVLPKAVFGIAERFSTFSVVVYNAILGWYLFRGKFENAIK